MYTRPLRRTTWQSDVRRLTEARTLIYSLLKRGFDAPRKETKMPLRDKAQEGETIKSQVHGKRLVEVFCNYVDGPLPIPLFTSLSDGPQPPSLLSIWGVLTKFVAAFVESESLWFPSTA